MTPRADPSTWDASRCAVLHAAAAHAAAGAPAIGLVSLGAPVGLDLELDRTGLEVGSRVVGPGRVPERSLPPVRTRVDGSSFAVAEAVSQVPDGALPVLTSTWAFARLAPARREAFLADLVAAGAHRPLAWVSVEGVGVAPGVPTLGDRPASGHSIVAVTLVDADGPRVEVVGRCWSRGRVMSWLAPG